MTSPPRHDLPTGVRTPLVAVLLLAPFITACTSHATKMEQFSAAWETGNFQAADSAIDTVIASECGVEPALVAESRGLAPEIDPSDGDTSLFLMEKAMSRLALGDPDATIDLLRKSRDVLDPLHENRDVMGFFKAVAVDDAVLDFTGADYEHIVLRAVLAIADLLDGGEDAFAYAIQIDEKQERILGSEFGTGLTDADGEPFEYKPQEQYRRVPIGTYLLGLVQESKYITDEASKAYSRALEWSGGNSDVIQRAYDEMSGTTRFEPGTGVVSVFYFGGRGPKLVAAQSDVSDTALLLAQIGVAILESSFGPLAQTPVQVPVVQVQQEYVPPLEIRVAGQNHSTETLLDVNAVAKQQRDANMPWFVARAVLRRAFKAGVSQVAANQVDNEAASQLVNVFGNLLLTAGERTDTRCWTTLPASIQVARVRLPEGEYLFDLAGVGTTGVRVRAGRLSHILVLRTDLAAPAAVHVDKYSGWTPEPVGDPTSPELEPELEVEPVVAP